MTPTCSTQRSGSQPYDTRGRVKGGPLALPLSDALFDASTHAATEAEKAVAGEIFLHCRTAPVSLESIRSRCELADERTVKGIVERLRRVHGLPIGVSRIAPTGYWWASTAADLIEASEPMRRQAITMLTTVARMRGYRRLAELLGQEAMCDSL